MQNVGFCCLPLRGFALKAVVLTLSLSLGFQTAYAAPSKPDISVASGDVDYVEVVPKSRYSGDAEKRERARRMGILERANRIFSLFGAEVAQIKGREGTALATYQKMLTQNPSPEVAGRLVQLAIEEGNDALAESAYETWRTLEPEPSNFQRRMAWLLALRNGDMQTVSDGLHAVLENSNDNEQRQLFLEIVRQSFSQLALLEITKESSSASREGDRRFAKLVNREAKARPEMLEAVLADVVVSSAVGERDHAIEALGKLVKLAPNLNPKDGLALLVIQKYYPDILSDFFSQHRDALPPSWQKIQISWLLSHNRIDEAAKVVNDGLARSPSADGYLQAAYLAIVRHQPEADIMKLMEEAYRIAVTPEQKSKAARAIAMRFIDLGRYSEALIWAQRSDFEVDRFDREMLMALVAVNQQQPKQALKHLNVVRKRLSDGYVFTRAQADRLWSQVISTALPPKQAVQELSKAIVAAKKQENEALMADLLYQRGLLYADHLNRFAAAVADFRQYLDIYPNEPQGLNALGYTLLLSPNANIDEAFEYINSAYQLDPEAAAVNDSLGWAYYRKGDAEAALPYLEYAYNRFPEAEEVSAHYAEVLYVLGKTDEAQFVLDKALQEKPKHKLLNNLKHRIDNKLIPQKNR